MKIDVLMLGFYKAFKFAVLRSWPALIPLNLIQFPNIWYLPFYVPVTLGKTYADDDAMLLKHHIDRNSEYFCIFFWLSLSWWAVFFKKKSCKNTFVVFIFVHCAPCLEQKVNPAVKRQLFTKLLYDLSRFCSSEMCHGRKVNIEQQCFSKTICWFRISRGIHKISKNS